MGKIANLLWSLSVGVLLVAAGLARDMSLLLAIGLALAGAAAVFSFLNWWTGPGRRVFLADSVTPKFLTSIYAGRTSVQADKAVEIYIGKWMKVSGSIYNVASRGPRRRQIHLNTKPAVFLTFHGREAQTDVLHKGDIIHAQGKIEGIHGEIISLGRCELLTVEPKADSLAQPPA
jgi:hypothetical protein